MSDKPTVPDEAILRPTRRKPVYEDHPEVYVTRERARRVRLEQPPPIAPRPVDERGCLERTDCPGTRDKCYLPKTMCGRTPP